MERTEFDKNDYLQWLISLVTPDIHIQKKYKKVFRIMLKKPFIWTIHNDDNRATDGLNLRLRYSDLRGGVWSKWLSEAPCSMLEMMVGLAVRCEEEIMFDEQFGDRTFEWFWAMMDNSGLLECGISGLIGRELETKVERILDRINNRTYAKNGKGGLFLTQLFSEDMRKVEIWYQMNYWLTENFEV